MNPLSAALESRIAAHAPALSVRLPSGRWLGATNARVRLAMKSWAPFAHLVTGQIGRLAEDHVQGRVDLTGSMRDIVEAAAALLGFRVILPVDAASSTLPYNEQYTAWHLGNSPRVGPQTTLTRIDQISF